MADKIHSWAAPGPGKPLAPFEFDPGPLAPDQVEVEVGYCGVCHSDLSMVDNEWGNSSYPLVPGHEIVGRVASLGAQARGLEVGQRVGVGWFSGSCQHCRHCAGGEAHLCADTSGTIVGRHGGFADRVRAQWNWVFPLPASLDPASAGPLFCGGITVFSPILLAGVKPTDRVGVVGIGGLGHMALKFLRAWGCEVTAFTSTDSKREEALRLGAHHAVSSTDKAGLKRLRRSLDLILVTVNVPLDWNAYVAALNPKGRLHVVGAVLEPIPVMAFSLIGGEKTVGGSPTGSPSSIMTMLDFAARHGIAPQVEAFPMAKVNEALEHLRSGKARYRIVLTR